MADLRIGNTSLSDLKKRASLMADAAESLAALLDKEAMRLDRVDQAARLKAMQCYILQEVERARRSEMAASSGHSNTTMIMSLFQLGASLAAKASQDATAQVVSHLLLDGPGGAEPPFGRVLISVGPAGLPRDAHVVNISGQARESKRDERQVTDELTSRGFLLLTPEAFSRLVEALAGQVIKEELSLPVSAETLRQLQARPKPNIVIMETI